MEFKMNDWESLKVSPMKAVIRIGKKGKLSSRYIGSNRISKIVNNVAYKLEPPENVGVNDSLSYKEILIQILDRQVCRLQTNEVVSVKVLWRNQFFE